MPEKNSPNLEDFRKIGVVFGVLYYVAHFFLLMARITSSPSFSTVPAPSPGRAGWWVRMGRWWRGEVATELEEPLHASGQEERRRRPVVTAGHVPVSAVAVPTVAAETGGVFKIHCLPVADVVDLPARIQAECERQGEGGLSLSSSFVHDGHAFLVFKREPPPSAGESPRFSA